MGGWVGIWFLMPDLAVGRNGLSGGLSSYENISSWRSRVIIVSQHGG